MLFYIINFKSIQNDTLQNYECCTCIFLIIFKNVINSIIFTLPNNNIECRLSFINDINLFMFTLGFGLFNYLYLLFLKYIRYDLNKIYESMLSNFKINLHYILT